MRWPWRRHAAQVKPPEQAAAELADAQRIADEANLAARRAHEVTTQSRQVRRENHFADTMRALLEA